MKQQPASLEKIWDDVLAHPSVRPRLDAWKAAYPDVCARIQKALAQRPDKSVELAILSRMLSDEDNQAKVAVAREWASQYPGLFEKLQEQVKHLHPLRQTAVLAERAEKLVKFTDGQPLRNRAEIRPASTQELVLSPGHTPTHSTPHQTPRLAV